MSPGWGGDGTAEEGVLFVVSMLNCTMYQVTKHREIRPWIVGDGNHGTCQFMPRDVFRAPQTWERLAGELIVSGLADHNFASAAPLPGEPARPQKIVRVVIDEQGPWQQPKLNQVDVDYPIPPNARSGIPRVAPESFGPFGGHRFRVTAGTTDLMQTTMMPDGALPYDSQIIRIDPNGEEHLFVDKVQSGHPAIILQGDRMILSRIRKSYSTGDYHIPV